MIMVLSQKDTKSYIFKKHWNIEEDKSTLLNTGQQ